MKKVIVICLALSYLFSGCDNHAHTHEESSNELEALAYTIYTDKTELFLEFKPLVIGKESRFAAHFTHLGEYFKPFTEGTIELTLEVNGKRTSIKTDTLMVPGIFRLRMSPQEVGKGRLIFDIKTKEITDQIIINDVIVYADEKTALKENPPSEENGNNISYLKEQAWKVEFANVVLKKQAFCDIIKTSGQILSAPGDEMVVTAKANGIVLFSGNKTIIGSEISSGTNLFTISSGDFADGNIDSKYKEAKNNFEKSKGDYERNKELAQDKIVSEKDFLQSKTAFENAQATYNAIAKNYSANGQSIVATMGGFVKNIYVTEGQFVEAGTPLATISKNKKLILQANVSQKYFEKLSSITSSNFKTTDDGTVYDTKDLNGKVISFGKSTSANSPFIPITFEINNTGNLISGSVVEVYLKSFPIPNALVISVTSLIEEQGNFFVYVQTEGESFQKREIKIGASDGINVQLISGVKEGERVVTKGAYQIKLSTASGSLPTHGHEH